MLNIFFLIVSLTFHLIGHLNQFNKQLLVKLFFRYFTLTLYELA